MKSVFLGCALAASTSAHFVLNYPPARGFDEDQLPQYPCGGQYAVSSNRTQVPIGSAFPIQLDMHHTASLVTVVLATGNTPSDTDFNQLLLPTIQERGPQNFCLGGIVIPSSPSITPGSNGTIQVSTNGDSSDEPGLYNCADVTFVSPQSYIMDGANCQNSTGVNVQSVSSSEQGKSANGTVYGMGGAPSMAAAPSGTSVAAAASSSSGAAAVARGGAFAGLGVVAVGVVLVASMGMVML